VRLRAVMSRRVVYQSVTVALGLTPALMLIAGLVRWLLGDFGALGGDPVDTLTHETGAWALRLLLASLAITPLRTWLRWRTVAPLRRTLGLLAFLYATLHLLTYAILDRGLLIGGDPEAPSAAAALLDDVVKRPYITVGFAAFSMLFALALTSTRAAIRRLGRRWQALHRLAYVAAVASVVHFLWLVKLDPTEPLIYGAILACLLALRVPALQRAVVPRSARQVG
jgi:sulfoxide reductase heme-binding subunit YedZ